MFGGEASHLPLKLNTVGRDPADLRLLAAAAAGDDRAASSASGQSSAGSARSPPIWRTARRSTWCSISALIVFFCFFYTAIVFNPAETADNLRKYGGFIPGIRPGKNTADYLDYVLTRITVIGAIYLSAVCILPEILISQYSVPFYFGGTSLLIVVSVTMDTVAQVHSHLLAHQYEGLIKKAQAAGRGADPMNLILVGPARRRQGNAGEAARSRRTASSSSRPATCCAPRSPRARELGQRVKAIMEAGALVSDDIIIAMIAGADRRAGCRERLHPRRLSAHRAAGRGARRDAGRAGRAARPRDPDGGRRGGADRAHRRPLHLRANAAPAITTASSRPTADGRLRRLRQHRLRAPRRRPAGDGGDPARRLSQSDRADPALLPRSAGSCARSTAWPTSTR